MDLHFILILCWSVCGLCSALFLFKDKGKPLIYCYKICPLYCSKHATKRYDFDESSLTYLHDDPYTAEVSAKYSFAHWSSITKSTKAPPTTAENSKYLDYNPYLVDDGSGDYEHYPYSYEHWKKTTKKPTTETPKTTTEQIYLDHNPYEDVPDYDFYPVPHFWKPKPKTTTTATTTTEKPIYLEHNPYEDLPDYDFHPLPHFWKPKPTTTTTTTTTSEKPIYLDHNPYLIWPDYDHHPIHYGWKPTSTTAAPTTEEPTFICQVCIAKCGDKFS